MKTAAAILACLLSCTAASAGRLVIPIQDLMLEVPNFTDAPSFDLNAALQGSNPIGNSGPKPKRKTQKEREKEVVALLELAYPEAISIRLYRGNAIITTPDS